MTLTANQKCLRPDKRAPSKAADPGSSRRGSPRRGRSLRPAPPPLPSCQAGRPVLLRRLSHRWDPGYWARRQQRQGLGLGLPTLCHQPPIPKELSILTPHSPRASSTSPFRSTVNGKTVAPRLKHVPQAGRTREPTDRSSGPGSQRPGLKRCPPLPALSALPPIPTSRCPFLSSLTHPRSPRACHDLLPVCHRHAGPPGGAPGRRRAVCSDLVVPASPSISQLRGRGV